MGEISREFGITIDQGATTCTCKVSAGSAEGPD